MKALARVSGLRAVRLARGLTQAEVAQAAGLKGDALVCRWERRPPALWGRLARIADVLNVSADELLGRAPVTPVVDALARADRELLDAMAEDAEALFGPEVLQRVGGWRRIARELWLGHLIGARDRSLQRTDNRAVSIAAGGGQ